MESITPQILPPEVETQIQSLILVSNTICEHFMQGAVQFGWLQLDFSPYFLSLSAPLFLSACDPCLYPILVLITPSS